MGRPKKVVDDEFMDKLEEKYCKDDNVNSPSHYKIDGLDIESIDIIKGALDSGYSFFCIGNIMKYIIRAEKKNGIEDYEKARRYLEFIKEKGLLDSYPSDMKKNIETFLHIDWNKIVIAICKNMTAEKALLINSIFNCVFNKKLDKAIGYLTEIIGDGKK